MSGAKESGASLTELRDSDCQPTPRSVVEGFQGDITPPRVSPWYRLGLLVVAVVMVWLPAVYVGLVALAGLGVYYHATHAYPVLLGEGNAFGKALIYFGPLVVGLTLILFMVKPLFARRPRPPEYLALKPENEPLLFTFIGRICRLVNAPEPRRVQVNCEVNASASFRRGLGSFLSNDLTLTIGLPLVAGLNLRQFAGVLAHEFGHFAQGVGLRLTYLIRQVNFWFARVVYERDEWDLQLDQAARNSDWRIAIVLHTARGCVWLSRRILWALMHVGQAVSCFMLRQMEYDADSYECKVAGSDTFGETALRLRALGVATGAALEYMRESWKNRRLPDNVPTLIAQHAALFSAETHQRIQAQLGASKTRIFDTHPSDVDRAQAAHRLNAPGIFRLTEPADRLFRDFVALSRSVTRVFYEKEHELPVAEENLVPAEESLKESMARHSAQQALWRYLHGLNPLCCPLPLAPNDLHAPTDEATALATLRSARERLEQQQKAIAAAMQEFQRLDVQLVQAGNALCLLQAVFRIQANEFGLERADTSTAMEAQRELTRQMEAVDARLAPFAREASRRLTAALQLLVSASTGSSAGAEAFGEAARWLELAARLAPRLQPLHELRRKFSALRLLLANRPNHPNPAAVDRVVIILADEMRHLVNRIRAGLTEVPYPFPHARGLMSLDQYLRAEDASRDEIEAVYHDSVALVDRLFPLYEQVLGRLVAVAEGVEARRLVQPDRCK